MPRFRMLLQGQGEKPDGVWFGFYAGRQVTADTAEVACEMALAAIDADWAEGESVHLGRLGYRRVIATWPVLSPFVRRGLKRGHTFYCNEEAQEEALKLEFSVARPPRKVGRSLLAKLAERD